MAKKPTFTVQVLHDGGAAGSVRFQVHDGTRATLAFPGISEQPPAIAGTTEDLDLDALRAGRFIRIDEEGRRRSYQLSRLDRAALLGASAAEWHALDESNDGGFRYLMLPAATRGPAVAAVQLKAAAPAVTKGSGLRARAMAAGRTAPAAPARSTAAATPARRQPQAQTQSSAPSGLGKLTRKSLGALDREQAIAALSEAYETVASLEAEVARLGASLAESKQREGELIELLGRWKSRG